MSYTLITNRKPRHLVTLAEMPAKARADFDYIDSDDEHSPRFVHYRHAWYDVFDSQRIEPDNGRAQPVGWAYRVHPGEPLARFDCIITESYFSGVAFAIVDDGDSVVCARIYS